MIEEGKHNALSVLVWQHWLKTGLPLTRKAAREQFAKLDHEDSFKDHLVDGLPADCEEATYYVPKPLRGWMPTREWIRRQIQRMMFSATFTGVDHDDAL